MNIKAKKNNEGEIPSRIERVAIGKGTALILGSVKGLAEEGDIVKKLLQKESPDAVALHIGKEELEGLRSVVDGKVKNTYLSSYEKVYARKLSRFGEVQIPPPSLVEAMRWAIEEEKQVLTLDFNDDEYDSVYTDLVSGLTMVRQSLRLKRINRHRFKVSGPMEFALEWDRISNRLSGLKRLERRREKEQARNIVKYLKGYPLLFCVVEYERAEGIISLLNDYR
mgnify:CR=1 FL=1